MEINLTNYIDSIYNLIININTVKINYKKNIYSLKEGIINFNVKLDNKPKCNLCNKNLICHHIFYILIKYYKLSNFVLSFIGDSDIYNEFLKNIKKKELNYCLEQIITKKIEDTECGICLENLKFINYNDFGKGLYKCSTCKKYLHSKCIDNWFSKSKGLNNRGKCIFCLS